MPFGHNEYGRETSRQRPRSVSGEPAHRFVLDGHQPSAAVPRHRDRSEDLGFSPGLGAILCHSVGAIIMTMKTSSRPVALQDFVSELRKFPEAAFVETTTILNFLQTTPVSPDTLAPYLTWDRQHYTRNLIDKTPLYELLAICWEMGQVSSVHNHREQNCWMAVPIGRLMVENFRVLAQDLDAGKCRLEPSDTCEMNSAHPCAVDPLEPVHRVLNPREFNERAVSLHVYSRPFNTCVVYSPEQGTCGVIQLHYNTEYGRPVKM